jgi:cytochrome c biogenesis protein CcmG/thiol:disulfide interchange protein DsbE
MATNKPLIRKIFSLIIYISIATAIAFLIIDRHPPSLIVDAIAPINEKLEFMTGASTTFKRLLKKPMVVNFWASWCPSCQKELPVLSKLAKKYHGQIIFLGPAVASKKEDMLALKKRFLLDYDLAIIKDDVVDKWHAHALPTTYLIDVQGRILWARSGVFTEKELDYVIHMALDNRTQQLKRPLQSQ